MFDLTVARRRIRKRNKQRTCKQTTIFHSFFYLFSLFNKKKWSKSKHTQKENEKPTKKKIMNNKNVKNFFLKILIKIIEDNGNRKQKRENFDLTLFKYVNDRWWFWWLSLVSSQQKQFQIFFFGLMFPIFKTFFLNTSKIVWCDCWRIQNHP